MEQAAATARRQHTVRAADVEREDVRGDTRPTSLELVAPGIVRELVLVQVHHVLQRSTSPKTMSCVPMIATSSAIMWPRAISSSAERWAKPGAPSFRR